jgi:ABC-type uncharacterized transport system substrate-binding protein
MKKTLLYAAFLLCLGVQAAFAHPHAFVECAFSFVMDERGLAGFRQRWVLDEMTTVTVLDVVDKNRDAVLNAEEKAALREMTENSLKEFHYFTAARINGVAHPIQAITDFSAELKENKLIYEFLVPCRVAAVAGKPQEVKAAVYDDSFYTYVAFGTENGPGIDPSKDPLFANREAPARPDDYKRFSKAVGIGKFSGKIRIMGEAAKFKISSEIEDAPEMAYFFGQIVPQSFVIRFEPR